MVCLAFYSVERVGIEIKIFGGGGFCGGDDDDDDEFFTSSGDLNSTIPHPLDLPVRKKEKEENMKGVIRKRKEEEKKKRGVGF